MAGSLPLVALATAIAALPLGAQSRITVAAGVASASLTREVAGSGGDNSDRRAGLAAAIGTRRIIGRGLALAPEFLFVMKGASEPNGDASLRFGYLEFPVLVRYDLDADRRIHPFLAAGPVASVMLGCTLDDGRGFSQSCDEAYGHGAGYRRFDLGIAATAGLQFGDLALSVRRTFGMRDVDETPDVVASNRALLVLVAFDL